MVKRLSQTPNEYVPPPRDGAHNLHGINPELDSLVSARHGCMVKHFHALPQSVDCHRNLTWMNPSNMKAVSMGPPAASGWNCTADQGLAWWMMPSLVLSLAFVNRVFHPSGKEDGSTANLFSKKNDQNEHRMAPEKYCEESEKIIFQMIIPS